MEDDYLYIDILIHKLYLRVELHGGSSRICSSIKVNFLLKTFYCSSGNCFLPVNAGANSWVHSFKDVEEEMVRHIERTIWYACAFLVGAYSQMSYGEHVLVRFRTVNRKCNTEIA